MLVSIAMMSALAIFFDVFSDTLSIRVAWGMKIDFVGTVWVLSYFLYGLSVAFPVSIITTLFIALVMPTSFIGGAMKFIATIPMFLVPALLSYVSSLSNRNQNSIRSSKLFNSLLMIIGVAILANVVRLVVATTANYYWAIPLWLGIPTDRILDVLFGGSIVEFVIYVAGLNVIQGIIDIFVSWLLAFKFKLSAMFGTW